MYSYKWLESFKSVLVCIDSPGLLPDLVGYYTGASTLAGVSGTLPYLALGLATALAMLASEILTR